MSVTKIFFAVYPIIHFVQFSLISNAVKVSQKYPVCTDTVYYLERIYNSCLKKVLLSTFLDGEWQNQGLAHQAEPQQPSHPLLSALMPTAALWTAWKCQIGRS